MSDKSVVYIGENSPERVAYLLAIDVSNAEHREGQKRDRKQILDTYAECLEAVRGHRKWK